MGDSSEAVGLVADWQVISLPISRGDISEASLYSTRLPVLVMVIPMTNCPEVPVDQTTLPSAFARTKSPLAVKLRVAFWCAARSRLADHTTTGISPEPEVM
uniref:Uncharacterized protein n=1 Tax=Oryza nivara TaxID=4536 RepID=A0A0E0FI92_ORYNI